MIIFRVVDLPAPFGPSSPYIEPLRTVIDTLFTGYRPKCVSGGLVVRLPFDPCVELVPVDAGAVSCGDAERLVLALRASLPCLPVEALESFVGHRVGREPRVGLGMRRVLVAPPADRLQPSDQPQSTVAAQHVAQARVP